MVHESEREQLRQELREIDDQIAELPASDDELKGQVGGQDVGAQDPEDIAAALTSGEENEGVLDGLRKRQETVRRKLGEDGQRADP